MTEIKIQSSSVLVLHQFYHYLFILCLVTDSLFYHAQDYHYIKVIQESSYSVNYKTTMRGQDYMGRVSFLTHLWKQQTLTATLITMLFSNEQHLGHGQFILLSMAFSPLHTIPKQILSKIFSTAQTKNSALSKVKIMYQVLTIQYFKKNKYIHTESVHWSVFFFVFDFFETGLVCIALAVLEFDLYTRLASKSQRSTYLCLPSAGSSFVFCFFFNHGCHLFYS